MAENRNDKQSELFEKVALVHLSYIQKIAYRLTGDRAMAEDLAQETFAVAFEKFYQLKDHDKCKSWLFMIQRNLFLGQVEKNKNKYFYDYDDLAYGLADHSHKQKMEWEEGFSDPVQHQLDRLDEKYKEPLMLSVLGEYTYKEIAEELDIPIGTVMSRIARGKTFLRKEITKQVGGKDAILAA